MPKYTLEAGRRIVRDGQPLAVLTAASYGEGYVSPTVLDALARDAVAALNSPDDFRACALELIKGDGTAASQQRAIELARRGLGLAHDRIQPPTTPEASNGDRHEIQVIGAGESILARVPVEAGDRAAAISEARMFAVRLGAGYEVREVGDPDGEHPTNTRAMWRAAILGGERRGYWEWAHAYTPPAEVDDFAAAKLAGYDVEPDGFNSGWIARDPDGDEIEQKATERSWPTERAAWEACEAARVDGQADV